MKQYIIRRILISFVVLFGVSILMYTLIRMMPSDYVSMSTSGRTNITEEMKEQLREVYGLDKGIVPGYIDWASKAIKGDFGISLVFRKPVIQVIKQYAPITFTVAMLSLIFEILIAIPLGILAARKQYEFTDYFIVTVVFIGISIPIFFLASVLKRSFGFYGLNILPMSGMLTARVNYDGFTFAKLMDYTKHLILPIFCFVFTSAGGWLRFTRSNMLEVLSSDYVRTARAKGVAERGVVYNHAFRNTLIPLVTMIGGSLPGMFSGATITEGLFGIAGLGNIAFKCANLSDVPYLMGFNMFLAVLTIVGYLLSDVLYALVDPRIRLS
jgi:peptide/nickel transport system permease protein